MRCTLFMAHYLCRQVLWGQHGVLCCSSLLIFNNNNVLLQHCCTSEYLCASSLPTFGNSPPRCRNSLYRRTFIVALSVSLRNDLADPVFNGVGLAVWAEPMLYCWPKLLAPFLSSVFHFCSFFLLVSIVGLRSSDWLSLNRSLPTCIGDIFK